MVNMKAIDTEELHKNVLRMIKEGIGWVEKPIEAPEGQQNANGYVGKFEKSWSFVVVSFRVDGQDCYDGSATDTENFRVIHLPLRTVKVLLQDAERSTKRQNVSKTNEGE